MYPAAGFGSGKEQGCGAPILREDDGAAVATLGKLTVPSFDRDLPIEASKFRAGTEIHLDDEVVDLDGRHASLGVSRGSPNLVDEILFEEQVVDCTNRPDILRIVRVAEAIGIASDIRQEIGEGAIDAVHGTRGEIQLDELIERCDAIRRIAVLSAIGSSRLEDDVTRSGPVVVRQDMIVRQQSDAPT